MPFLWMLLVFVMTSPCAAQTSGASVAQPSGYRLDHYDAPVPEALDGATRIAALEVLRLQQQKAALIIDVIPEHQRPAALADDQLWLPVPHRGVKGAIWLPDVGYGALSATTERYLVDNLATLTAGDVSRPLVFYCRMDCWMSWNAAKRALSYGYRNVYWFADGLDDWRFEDLELDTLAPAPGQRQAN